MDGLILLVHSSSFVDGHSRSSSETHHLPEVHHMDEDDYLAAAREMDNQRHEGQKTELDGRTTTCQVICNLSTPFEMNDQASSEDFSLETSRATSGNRSRLRGNRGDKSRTTRSILNYLSIGRS